MNAIPSRNKRLKLSKIKNDFYFYNYQKRMSKIVQMAVDSIYNINDGFSENQIINANGINFSTENSWISFTENLINSLPDAPVISITNEEMCFMFRNYEFKITHDGEQLYIKGKYSQIIN